MANRNSGKAVLLAIAVLISLFSLQVTSCTGHTNAARYSKIIPAVDNSILLKGFVDDRYLHQAPLACLQNIQPYEEREDSFVLEKDATVRIYGVGEAGVFYMDKDPRYLFRSDDIQFYFDFSNIESDIITDQEGRFNLNFSWLDGAVKSNHISFTKQGCEYAGYYDTLNKGYVAEIKFPWKVFNIPEMLTDTTVSFDIAVGDNDDGLIQSGKVIWHNRSDLLTATTKHYGKLSLIHSLKAASPDTAWASPAHPLIDGMIDSLWNKTPPYPIQNEVMEKKDPSDLSAFFKTYWDKDNLYFLVVIRDQSKKVAKSKGLRLLRAMSDYGYLEDDKGNRIWEMHIKDARYAGGAQKNVKVEDAIPLKAGKYRLKYFSDESHAWNNWDDDPPAIPFYGIILYKQH